MAKRRKEKKAEPCWACALGRCGQADKDNTCPCCRRDHEPA